MRQILATFMLTLSLHAQPPGGGHAKVDLVTASTTYQQNNTIQAAVRMAYDDGWHGYWINPGEGGMKTEITWKLPAGWKASEPAFPVPQRTLTGELHNYGYHGTIFIPITFTAPANASGPIVIEGEVNWLACNDKNCVPGNAKLHLTMEQGPSTQTEHGKAIAAAIDALPRTSKEHLLILSENGDQITLSIEGPDLEKFSGAEIFPVTEQVLAPTQPWTFATQASTCAAKGPKNEYAPNKPIENIVIVVVGGKLPHPLQLEWSKNK